MSRYQPAVLRIVGGRHPVHAFLAGLLLALPLTVGLAAPAAAGPDPAAGAIDVIVVEGHVTVDVRDIALAEVLRAVGERAAVEITLQGDLSAPVTESFAGVPLEEGIRRLARGHSVMITYGAPAGQAEPTKLTGVWVMAAPSARAPIDSARTTPSAGWSAVKGDAAPVTPVEPLGESPLALRIGEIGRLAQDAGHGSTAAIVRLGEIGAADTSAELREQAVAALGRVTDPAAEPLLIAALADEEVSVRARAIRSLRTFGTDTAAQSIASALIGDPDPEVRLTALAAVGSLSGSGMLTMLERASADPNQTVRETALRWLAWWRSRGHATP